MKQSHATIAGQVFVENGKAQLKISGSNDVLSLIAENQAAPDANAMNGKTVVVQGTIPEAAKNKLPAAIRYCSIVEGKNEYCGQEPEIVGGAALLFVYVGGDDTAPGTLATNRSIAFADRCVDRRRQALRSCSAAPRTPPSRAPIGSDLLRKLLRRSLMASQSTGTTASRAATSATAS